MSVASLEAQDKRNQHASQRISVINGGGVDSSSAAAQHSHGHMLASNMAHESGPMPFHTSHAEKGGNGVAAAFVNMVSPINDPSWYRGANAFATRKTVIAALINIALLTSTAGQLKSLLRINRAYPFYNSLLGMLIVCILGEIAIGVLFFVIGRLNLNREEQRSRADLLQNIVFGVVVVVLILHIMNAAFGIEDLAYLVPGYPLLVPITAPASPSTTFAPTVLSYAYTYVNRTMPNN